MEISFLYKKLFFFVILCYYNTNSIAQIYPASSYTLDQAVIPNMHTALGDDIANFYVYKPSNYNPITSPILFGCYATGSNGLDVAQALQAMADARGALVVAAYYVTQINEPISSVLDSLYLNYPIGGFRTNYPATLFYKHIYRRVLEREGRTSIPCYMLGFSAGGQFVSRYMFWRQSYPDSIPIRMAVSCNPYFYTFPTKEHKGLPMYYADGLDLTGGLFNYPGSAPKDSIEKKIYNYIGCNEHIKQYYNENYAVVIGASDNANLGDYGPINTQQGTNRYDRSKNFYEFALADAPNYSTSLNWQYKEVPGMGHSQGGMFYTKENITDSYSIVEHILFDSPYNPVIQSAPVADFIVDNTVVSLPTAMVSFTNRSSLANTYLWSFGDGQYSSEVSPTHVYTHTGKYIVQLNAKNNNGCENWMSKFYLVEVVGTNPTVVATQTIVPEPEISLDSHFGVGGKSIVQVGSPQDYARSVVIQNDGKIIMAGSKTNGFAGWDFAVTRFNLDGSLDITFDTDGISSVNIGSKDDKAYSVALQNDGKIVVGGSMGDGTDYNFALTRFNTDGSLDNTFDGDGIVVSDFGSSQYDFGYDVAIQADGKIILAGHSYNGTYYEFSMARYNIDGTLDVNFDGDGMVKTSIGSKHDYAYSIALQSDGKIVLVGRSNDGVNDDFAIVRYNIDGSLDNTFDSDGKVVTEIGSSKDVSYSVAIQSDGKIVAVGTSNNGKNNDFALIRYNTDGSLDNSFDTDGKIITSLNKDDDFAYDVAIDSKGKIWVAGHSYTGSNYDFALTCYLNNGTLDNTFDNDGKATTRLNAFGIGGHDYGYSLAIQNDDKIIIAGYSWRDPYSFDYALVRYNTCTSIDNSVNQSGVNLQANSIIASYQWLNCDNNSLIVNEINRDFIAIADGSYAVQINENGCVDTSSCFQITITTNTDVNIIENNNMIKLKPNPSVDEVLVSFNNSQAKQIEVTSITGDVVFKAEINEKNELKIPTKNWSNGMYFVSAINENQKLTLKLLVQH